MTPRRIGSKYNQYPTALFFLAGLLLAATPFAWADHEVYGRIVIKADDGSHIRIANPEAFEFRLGGFWDDKLDLALSEQFYLEDNSGRFKAMSPIRRKDTKLYNAKILFRNSTLTLLPAAGSPQSALRQIDEVGKPVTRWRVAYLESAPIDFHHRPDSLQKNVVAVFDDSSSNFKTDTGYRLDAAVRLMDMVRSASELVAETSDAGPMHHVYLEGRPRAQNPFYRLDTQTISFNEASAFSYAYSPLLHEYGHAVFHKYFGQYDYKSDGGNPPPCRKHTLTAKIDTQCAFLEGWASFFAIAVQADFDFGELGQFRYGLQVADFEPRRELITTNAFDFVTNPFDYSSRAHWVEDQEGYVTAVLWRLHMHGGVPMAAFLDALQRMRSGGVASDDATLQSYLPFLAKAFGTHKTYSKREAKVPRQAQLADLILEPFPSALSMWTNALSSQHDEL